MPETISILDRLSRCVKSMQKLHSLEVQKANKAQQDIVDNNYRRIVEKTELLCKAVQYARVYLDFRAECLPDVFSLLSFLQNVGLRGLVEQGQVDKATKAFIAAQDKTKKEWAKHYQALTGSTVSTLKTIKGLDENNITPCIAKIDAASAWDSTVTTLINLHDALIQANEIIQDLKLDQEVTTFLGKITAGRATLEDLNENVLQWLRNEQLLSKIKLAFARF